MKSKQSYFQQIITKSANKVKTRSVAGAKDEFQQRMKTLPTKIKQLNADPYMFIFDLLITFNEQVDYTLTQYQNMMAQNFLNPENNSTMLVRHFRSNLQQHSFRIVQILMEIKQPNIQFMELFFQINNGIAMPQNVAEALRYNGYRWMSKTFAFRQMNDKPEYISQLTSGILKTQNRNLPTYEDQQRSLKVYIQKMLKHMTRTIQNNLKPSQSPQKIVTKYGLCFMCLQPADYYCKDTKAPVCSSTCKKAHIAYITNNPAIDYRYSQKFRQDVQRLLFVNLKKKKNMALSIDYLCSIYMNTNYEPKQALPHRQLLNSPVIIERIWVLYTMYHLRKNQIFQHIFADCLKSKIDYICINSAKYFLKIAQAPCTISAQGSKINTLPSCRLFQIYQYLDFCGYKRVFPIIINNLHDEQYKLKFISGIIDRIFQYINANSNFGSNNMLKNKQNANKFEQDSGLISTLLRTVNFGDNCKKKFKEVLEQNYKNNHQNKKLQITDQQLLRSMMRFIIKNQENINRNKLCQIVLQYNQTKTIFLQQLLLHSSTSSLKLSPYIDQILRQIFFFINIKVSDSIYNLFQHLCQVLDTRKLSPFQCQQLRSVQLQTVFSDHNIKQYKQQKDRMNTFFQFCYLIIMLVTQVNRQEVVVSNSGNIVDKKSVKVTTQQEFISRVQNFDSRFAQMNKDYIVGVYNRVVENGFQQKSRGVLNYYPVVKKQNTNNYYNWSGQKVFNPISILLDNWQVVYEIFSSTSIKNIDSNTLYRCCCCLTNFPSKCQPFFQLLLSKLVEQSPTSSSTSANSMIASASRLKSDPNLLLFINNILQQQPNSVSITSWKYLFLRDPQSVTSTSLQNIAANANNIHNLLYLFDIGTLVHYSKMLNIQNFIYFVRQFCKNVTISMCYQQCCDLISFRYRKYIQIFTQHHKNPTQTLTTALSQQRAKLQILHKQYCTLFINETNYYYQVGNYQLGKSLLDIIPINMISEKLIVVGIIQVVETCWKDIQQYGRKYIHGQKSNKISNDGSGKKLNEDVGEVKEDGKLDAWNDFITIKQTNSKQQQSQIQHNKQKQQQQYNTIWLHIIQKIITICIDYPQILQQFSTLFSQTIPQLYKYYQILNIQYAIKSSFIGKPILLDSKLTQNRLHRFQKFIAQMYNCRQYQNQPISDNHILTYPSLLQQFVKQGNLVCIIQNFKYFWEIQAVYQLLVATLVKIIHVRDGNNNVIKCQDLHNILTILNQNSYKVLIKLENKYQGIAGYIVAVNLYIRNTKQHQQFKIKQNTTANNKTVTLSAIQKQYNNELLQVNKIITQKLTTLTNQHPKHHNPTTNLIMPQQQQYKQQKQQLQQQQILPLSQTYQYFIHIYNITYSYLYPIFEIIANNTSAAQAIHKEKEQSNSKSIINSRKNIILLQKQYNIIQFLCLVLQKINRNYGYRVSLYVQSGSNMLKQNINNSINSFKFIPSLLQQQYMANLIPIICKDNTTNQNINNSITSLCNWHIMHKYLVHNLQTYKKLLQTIKNNNKMKINKNSSIVSNSSNNNNNNKVVLNKISNKSSNTSMNNNNNSVYTNNNLSMISIQMMIDQHRQDLYNQQVKYCKQLLSTLYKILIKNQNISNMKNNANDIKDGKSISIDVCSILRNIQSVIVQYIQLGFDHYNIFNKKIQHNNNNIQQQQQINNYIYNIYKILNNNNNYY